MQVKQAAVDVYSSAQVGSQCTLDAATASASARAGEPEATVRPKLLPAVIHQSRMWTQQACLQAPSQEQQRLPNWECNYDATNRTM